MRGGLQALPKGQYEAADALGLSYWKKTGLIVLPQALRLVIPPLVNTFIGFFKDTSLVLIIGLFDLLTAGKVAISEPVWAAYTTEVYLVLAAIYFVFCYTMARYSRGLEREFAAPATVDQGTRHERSHADDRADPAIKPARPSCWTRSTSGTAPCTCCGT